MCIKELYDDSYLTNFAKNDVALDMSVFVHKTFDASLKKDECFYKIPIALL